MKIFINSGTGPVSGGSEVYAEANMRQLLTDCATKGLKFVRVPQHDDTEGRYNYLVYKETRCHLVEMPGLPLSQVRFIDDDQNPWQCTRLYVDGSSWLWKYALDFLTEDQFAEPKTNE